MRVKSYPVPTNPGKFSLSVPASRKIMWLQDTGLFLSLFVLEDENSPVEIAQFVLVKTDDPILVPVSGLQKIDTIEFYGRPKSLEYLHLFEIASDPPIGLVHHQVLSRIFLVSA